MLVIMHGCLVVEWYSRCYYLFITLRVAVVPNVGDLRHRRRGC